MKKFFIPTILFFSSLAHANLPYFPLDFPRDEGAHYENIPYQFDRLIEWWYFNGRLTTDDGRNLSYDVAFFNPALMFHNRVVIKPFLHIQVADLDNKVAYGVEKNYGFNAGKIATDKLDIVVKNDYVLRKTTKEGKEVYILKAEGQQNDTHLKVDLILEPKSPVFLINENGLMPMADNTNSYYYTIPHFETKGNVVINDTSYLINNTPGDSWNDHQWGDFNLENNGWEWFGLRLENGLIANIFLIFNYENNQVIDGLANVILPSGEKRFISYKEFNVSRENYWFDEALSISYPTTYKFSIPGIGLELTNVAAFSEQEKHGYWEGYCTVSGLYHNQVVNGFSYTEIVYNTPEATNYVLRNPLVLPRKMDALISNRFS